MQPKTENVIVSAVGPLAAILLGMALVPFRSYTSASNLTFLFLILTILTAEYGGRWGAFGVALASALSLDFFLTRPYMQLAIKGTHDIIAFAGLAVCGFMVAAFSSQRGQKATALTSEREQLALLHAAVSNLAGFARLESQLGKVLDALRACAPLTAAAVRDGNDAVLAAFGRADAGSPAQILSPLTLRQKGDADELRDQPFPKEGARVPLVFKGRQLGWLDLWGNGSPAGAEMRRTMSDVACLVAFLLEFRGQGEAAN